MRRRGYNSKANGKVAVYAPVGLVRQTFNAHPAGNYGYVFQPRFDRVGNSRAEGDIEAGRFGVFEPLQAAACRIRRQVEAR